MIKKLIVGSILLAATTLSLIAGNQGLAWDPYGTNDISVTTIKVYGAPGTNTLVSNVPVTSNTNAVVLGWTSVTNSVLTVSNLTSGPWTFVATAATAPTNGLESLTSNTCWTNILPSGVINFRFR